MNRLLTRVTIKPWMRDKEIGAVETLLRMVAPRRCLEWGAGNSTLYFRRRLPRGARWMSVEHDAAWFSTVRASVSRQSVFWRQSRHEVYEFHWRPRLEPVGRRLVEPVTSMFERIQNRAKVMVTLVSPNHLPWSDDHDDGTYEDLKDYVDFPAAQAPYDFILVDGRARSACLARARSWLMPNGVVVLHDAGRNYYHDSFSLYESQLLLTEPGVDEVGLWIGSTRNDELWRRTLSSIRDMWERTPS